MTRDTPKYFHDCTDCIFLGNCIGGGRIFDLYACKSKIIGDISRDASLVARRSNKPSDYYSTIAQMAHPEGHAELWAAKALWERHPLYGVTKCSA